MKENHQYVTKAAYVALGINADGRKDILGIWIGQHESAKFWAGVLNDLKSRGVQDVNLFCVDGLNGFREAIADCRRLPLPTQTTAITANFIFDLLISQCTAHTIFLSMGKCFYTKYSLL